MPDQPLSLIPALFLGIFIGLLVGAFTGFLAARMLKLPLGARNAAIDAILGAVIFPLAYEIVWLIPWRSTSTYRTGDSIVTTTSAHYQHPGRIAFVLAVLLPLLHEIVRARLAPKHE